MKIELPENKRLQVGPAGNVVIVSCCDIDGKPNALAVGMYMPISIRPPLVCIGIAPQRYSHQLIEETGEFVVNSCSISLEKEMHYTGTTSGRRENKFDNPNLTAIPSLKVKPPRIQECFGHLECRVVQKITAGDHTLFVGEVIATSADEDILTEDMNLDVLKAKPILQKNHVYFTVTDKKD